MGPETELGIVIPFVLVCRRHKFPVLIARYDAFAENARFQ
jgi:hypothetical protein